MARALLASLLGLVGIAAVACAPPPSLQLRGPILQAYPSIAAEIVTCVQRPEVHTVLGFDPLVSSPVTLSIFDSGPGTYHDGSAPFASAASINAYPYFQIPPLYEHIHDLLLRNNAPNGYESSEQFQQRVEQMAKQRYQKQEQLSGNPELALWYRCGIVVHELAHLRAKQDPSYPNSGHGVTDRIETKLYTELYHQGSLSLKMWQELYDFTTRFMNSSQESLDTIRQYQREVLSGDGEKL